MAKTANADGSSAPSGGLGPLDSLEPGALADRQLAVDRERTKRFPDLFVRKLQRMSSSPLAYLRGAAPLFFELLAAQPDLSAGPGGAVPSPSPYGPVDPYGYQERAATLARPLRGRPGPEPRYR